MDDELLICPYNTSHLIHRSRMLNHAVKCGKSHKGSARVCPFDPAHDVTESEYRSHLLQCCKNQPAKPMDNCFGKLFPGQCSTKGKAKKRRNRKNKQNCVPPKDPETPCAKEAEESCLSVNNVLNEENSVSVIEKDPEKPSVEDTDESCLSVNDVLNEGNSMGVMEVEEADGSPPSELDSAEEDWTVVMGKKESKQMKPKCGGKKQTSNEYESEVQYSDGASGHLAMNVAPLEENWDDLVGKVRYDPEKVSEMKPVLRAPQGRTKTERRKFRKDERLRYNLLANNQQRPVA